MKHTHMETMHQLTSMALSFVQEVKEYACGRGLILLQEEPIIHLRTEERLRLTITQPLYIGENDIELTIVGYLEEGSQQDMVVEATFDLLMPENADLNELHQVLGSMRNGQTTHFFVCIKGSTEDGFINDEISIVLRSTHRIGDRQVMEQWDKLLGELKKGQTTLSLGPSAVDYRPISS